jgi:hypothetical protein
MVINEKKRRGYKVEDRQSFDSVGCFLIESGEGNAGLSQSNKEYNSQSLKSAPVFSISG